MKTIILSCFFLLVISISFGQSGCTDSEACNYEPLALVDNGTCSDELVWFIPAVPSSGIDGSTPAVLACSAPLEYVLADPCCIEEVLLSDAYCTNTSWDQVCQGAYEDCQNSNVGCNNPEACNYDPCARVNDGSCTNQLQWYIPELVVDESGLAAVYTCYNVPEGYVLGNQEAILEVVTGDSYCNTNSWDEICQGEYEAFINPALQGCTDPEACNYSSFVNLDDGSCNYGYFLIITPEFLPNALPTQTCEIVSAESVWLSVPIPYCCVSDPESFVLEPLSQSDFDSLVECSAIAIDDSYCSDPLACNYGGDVQTSCFEECFYEVSYYMDSIYGTLYSSCTPRYYSDLILLGEKGSCCAQNVLDIYGLTIGEDWGITEWLTYHDCFYSSSNKGCTEDSACNYNPNACADDESCIYPGCTNALAVNFNPFAGCDNSSCEFIGCADYLAINYSPIVTIPNNNSCIYQSGCTYEGASNYDSMAITDDGSCIIQVESGCLGDLDGNNSVTAADLSLFLSNFGVVCVD